MFTKVVVHLGSLKPSAISNTIGVILRAYWIMFVYWIMFDLRRARGNGFS